MWTCGLNERLREIRLELKEAYRKKKLQKQLVFLVVLIQIMNWETENLRLLYWLRFVISLMFQRTICWAELIFDNTIN